MQVLSGASRYARARSDAEAELALASSLGPQGSLGPHVQVTAQVQPRTAGVCAARYPSAARVACMRRRLARDQPVFPGPERRIGR
jgi:hypothetical protein